MPDISIIVPVFRAEQTLGRCVDSILCQSFSDFTLILVDDGSPDRSGDLCDEYASKDSRVHVIHQTNGGPSRARNCGIAFAMEEGNSSFLCFVDSDDCLHPRYLELLHRAACENNTAVSMCRHRYIMLQENMDIENDVSDVVNISDPEDLMVNESASFNYAWGKLFSVKCFEQYRFPEDKSFGEDNLLIYRLLFEYGPVAFLPLPLYFYYFNPNGITKSSWTEKSLQVFEGIREQRQYYLTHGYERAYRKETELLIQQYAYQIHRLRKEQKNNPTARAYLPVMLRDMKGVLRAEPLFSLEDSDYWYEAVHPRIARVQCYAHRIAEKYRCCGLSCLLRTAFKRFLRLNRGRKTK